jgi:hypothetical protein
VTEFLYFARLAPLDETLIVSGKHGHTIEYFNASLFALEREQPERVAVLLDHDERRNVGHLDTLFNRDGWLVGTFRLNQRSSWSGVAEDLLEIGTPVSLAWEPNAMGDFLGDGIKRMVCGQLLEVSIVPDGAIRGAEIIRKIPLPQKSRVPSPSPQARPTTSNRVEPAGEVFHGGPIPPQHRPGARRPLTLTEELTQSCHLPPRRPHLPWPMRVRPPEYPRHQGGSITLRGYGGNGGTPAADGVCAGSRFTARETCLPRVSRAAF